MKKLFLLGLAMSLVLLSTSGAMAGSIVINDTPGLGPYTQGQQWYDNKTSPGPYRGDQTWADVYGNEFITQKVQITTNPNNYTIQIWTVNKPGGWNVAGYNWGVADIALNHTSQTAAYDPYTTAHYQYGGGPTLSSPYELGINMQAYLDPSKNGVANNVSLVQVKEWTTSFASVNQKVNLPSAIYGGGYKQSTEPASANRQPVETLITQTQSVIEQGTLSWVADGNSVGGYPEYLLTIIFAANPNLTLSDEFLWGTATCGNDIVHHVPLPATALLLGSGLGGLAFYRRRKLITH
jgi:hypothetical protein